MEELPVEIIYLFFDFLPAEYQHCPLLICKYIKDLYEQYRSRIDKKQKRRHCYYCLKAITVSDNVNLKMTCECSSVFCSIKCIIQGMKRHEKCISSFHQLKIGKPRDSHIYWKTSMSLKEKVIIDRRELKRKDIIAAFPYFVIKRDPLVEFVPSDQNVNEWQLCYDALIFCYVDDRLSEYNDDKIKHYLEDNDLTVLGMCSDYIRISVALVQRFLNIMTLHDDVLNLLKPL